MLRLIRTDSRDADFKTLVSELDDYLKITDGDEHDFYNQFNSIENLENVVIAYWDKCLVGCGALKKFDDKSIEVKRMFTKERFRRKRFAANILGALESLAAELDYEHVILETGLRQKEAVEFYKNLGYRIIPNYGQYSNMANSLCFKKRI